jgi:tetratricopeptide (TPR) repeat protein
VKARRLFERTIDLLQGADLANPQEREVLARAHHGLGQLYLLTRAPVQEAEGAFQKAQELLEPLVASSPRVGAFHDTLARVYHDQGTLCVGLQRLEDARCFFRQAQRLHERLTRRHPSLPAFSHSLALDHAGLAGTYRSLAGRATARGDRQAANVLLAQAEQHLLEAVAIREPFVRANPSSAGYRLCLLDAYINLGILAVQTDRPAEAEKYYCKGKDLMDTVVRDTPQGLAYTFSLGKDLFCLGDLLCQHQKPKEGLECLGHAITFLEDVHRQEPQDKEALVLLAGVYSARVNALNKRFRALETGPDLARAIEIQEGLLRQDPASAGVRTALVESLRMRSFNSWWLGPAGQSARDERRIMELVQPSTGPATKPDGK